MYSYFDMFVELENIILVVTLKFTITSSCTLCNKDIVNKMQLHCALVKIMM